MQTSNLAQQILEVLSHDGASASLAEFLAIPAGHPRWLIPADENVCSVLANWSPYRRSARLNWSAIRTANRIGALHALPNVRAVQVVNANEIDWRDLGWKRRTSPIPLIYVGTPGACQKAVIHLVEPGSGNCEAIVKVPLAEGARDAILREAGTLAALASEQFPFSPRLVHLDRQRGIATQQFLPGKPGSRRWRPEYWSLLRSLILCDELTTLAAHVPALDEELLSVSTQESHVELMRSALVELCDPRCLPACWVHGDFAPWNIRRRAHGAAALIDWEESERDGLPLQDAYHFFHMQDFLFGNRPTMHFTEAERLAKGLGISAAQCRKLEIAYLIGSSLRCLSRGEHRRADFLLNTLVLIVQDRAPAAAFAVTPPRRLRLVSSHPSNLAGERAELFGALVAQLNRARIPYCILSGYENSPGPGMHDVDIMFHAQDLHNVPGVLARTAQSVGALLLQFMQHETTGCYFVLAREHGKHIAYLDIDCYSAYRRDARTWMLADGVIGHRREYRGFYVPAVADEFTYYLIKKVLKQEIAAHHLKRLQHLFAGGPVECEQRIGCLWPAETARLLQGAIVEQKLSWLQGQLPNLLAELLRSPALETTLWRGKQTLCETARRLRRILFPTGLSIVVRGGNAVVRSELADRLVCNLSAAFRRARRIWTADAFGRCFAQIFQVWAARIQSTLVVRTAEKESPVTGVRDAVRQFVSLFARFLTPTDLVLSLCSGLREDGGEPTFHHRVLCLDADSSAEQILRNASRAILCWLASRTEKRLKLQSPARGRAFGGEARGPELRSAGLD